MYISPHISPEFSIHQPPNHFSFGHTPSCFLYTSFPSVLCLSIAASLPSAKTPFWPWHQPHSIQTMQILRSCNSFTHLTLHPNSKFQASPLQSSVILIAYIQNSICIPLLSLKSFLPTSAYFLLTQVYDPQHHTYLHPDWFNPTKVYSSSRSPHGAPSPSIKASHLQLLLLPWH